MAELNAPKEKTMTEKSRYLNICLQQSPEWLRQAYGSPTAYMRPIHLKLIAVAYRRMV